MKTQVCTKITILRYKTGIYISTEPIYQAISDCYDSTGVKTTAGISIIGSGICQDLSFHISLN